VNRCVTCADGKIFVGRLDGKLSALDAKTGDELWIADVVDRFRRRRVRRTRQLSGL
jgi:outer membrane protein assembly factor BamB